MDRYNTDMSENKRIVFIELCFNCGRHLISHSAGHRCDWCGREYNIFGEEIKIPNRPYMIEVLNGT